MQSFNDRIRYNKIFKGIKRMKMNKFLFPDDLHVPKNGRLHNGYFNIRKRDENGALWGYITWTTYWRVIDGICKYEMAHLKWSRL